MLSWINDRFEMELAEERGEMWWQYEPPEQPPMEDNDSEDHRRKAGERGLGTTPRKTDM